MAKTRAKSAKASSMDSNPKQTMKPKVKQTMKPKVKQTMKPKVKQTMKHINMCEKDSKNTQLCGHCGAPVRTENYFFRNTYTRRSGLSTEDEEREIAIALVQLKNDPN